MRDRNQVGSIRRWLGTGGPGAGRGRKRTHRPRLEGLEARQLLVASLNPIANLTVPADLGRVLPLDGGLNPQRFSATSDNPDVGVSVINGTFLSIDVSHASSGPGDPAFTGTITFQLFDELTPTTVDRILALVNQGFYTSPTTNPSPDFTNLPTKNFHRVSPGFPGSEFIVQGGSSNGNGTGEINQPGFPFRDEFVPSIVFTGEGQLAMANTGSIDDSNTSQFFVTTGSPRFLDFVHTIFGQVVEGQEVVEQMTQVSRVTSGQNINTPISPILITDTRVSSTNPNGTLLIDTTEAEAGDTATVTVTATDPADGSTDVETFVVVVEANTENQRPFLRPVTDQVTRPNEQVQFQLQAVSTNPGDVLSYTVRGGVSGENTGNPIFTPVQNATATVDASGLVTVTPNPGFEGVIDLLVGVRDQTKTNVDDPRSYEGQLLTLTVTNNNQPTATPVSAQTEENQAVTIQLAGQTGNPESQQTLFYELTGPPVNGLVSNFNATTGTLTYTPFANFSGVDTFGFRVRDVGSPSPNLTSLPAEVSVTVQPGAPVNIQPTAFPQQISTVTGVPIPVQLTGNPNNPGQTLTYSIDTAGTRGVITDFNPDTGTFVYSPPSGFIGTDTLTFRVQDVGPPEPNLQSEPATVTFTVTGAVDTGAVRRIGTSLIVTPPPGRLINPTPNVVTVNTIDGRIVVTVNGQVDNLRPLVSELERVIVYGTKANDTITIAPDVPLIATLDGGLGGRNSLKAGDIPSRLHGWFGRNTLQGGAARDALIGRMGRVRFLPSAGDDLVFAGDPNITPQVGNTHKAPYEGEPPTGQFFRFVNGRLVPVPTPAPQSEGRIVLHPPRTNLFIPDLTIPDRSEVVDTPPASEPGPAALARQRQAERLQQLRAQRGQAT